MLAGVQFAMTLWGYELPEPVDWVPLLVMSLMVGFFEAVFFRGFIQGRLEASFGPGLAVLGAAVLYSLYHVGYGMPGDELVFLFGLGVVYAIAFRLVSNILVLWPLLTPLGAFYNNVEAGDIDLPWASIAGFADVAVVMAVAVWFTARHRRRALERQETDVGHSRAVQAHWDSVYAADNLDELGWYEPRASTLGLVTAYSTPADSVIDVGGGTSPLTLELARLGYRDLTVLDISERALRASRTALRDHVEVVSWARADVTRYRPDRRWQIWHDRAVFHFLVDQDDREAYRSVAASAVESGGILIVATFAPEGPDKCAGLEVRRYDAATLAGEFAPDFDLIESRRLIPIAQVGDQRPYIGAVLRRVG